VIFPVALAGMLNTFVELFTLLVVGDEFVVIVHVSNNDVFVMVFVLVKFPGVGVPDCELNDTVYVVPDAYVTAGTDGLVNVLV
jgi:hypothetical protein